MKTINLSVSDVTVRKTSSASMTSKSVNDVFCQFSFGDDWSAFVTRIAVFYGSGEYKSVMLSGTDPVAIPWECLTKHGDYVKVSVVGIAADGVNQRTTTYCALGAVEKGGDAEADLGAAPTPSVITEIQGYAVASAAAAADAATAASQAAEATVSTASINETGHLIVTLAGGAVIDAGPVQGPVGPRVYLGVVNEVLSLSEGGVAAEVLSL